MNEIDIEKFFEIELGDATPEDRYFYAVMLGAYDRIVEALDSGVFVDVPRFNHGATALIFAKTAEITRLLLERGANPNALDWEGAKALNGAIAAGDIARVRLLLDYGADPLLESPFGTP